MTHSEWEFKTIRKTAAGVEFIPLSSEQERRLSSYAVALQTALVSKVAHPPFSNYFVKESLGIVDMPKVQAGNIEYGWCQAIHGEESAVAAFRSVHGREEDLNAHQLILGIIAGNPDHIANPCGNCRDIMLEDLGEDFEIVSGAAEGGVAIVMKMSDYLFKYPTSRNLDYPMLRQDLTALCQTVLRNARSLENDAYSPGNVHPERRYYAMIANNAGYKDFGAHDVMCEYHPIYALRDAIRQARRIDGVDSGIREVVIVGPSTGKGIPPHVMYKDRQHLLELNLQGELMMGLETDPQIHLLTFDEGAFLASGGKEVILVDAWTTSVKEWLPFPFSPRNFGPEFIQHLTDYYRNRKK